MKALILIGHPTSPSLVQSLAEAYGEGLRSGGAGVEIVSLPHLRFDALADPRHAPLEDDLKGLQEKIAGADHLVIAYPTWWGAAPAVVKAVIDRAFLPGFAYKYREGSPFADQLLKGRTASLIVTMDAPTLWYRFMQGEGGTRAMVKSTLQFCGFRMASVNYFPQIRFRSPEQIQAMVEKAKRQGARDATRSLAKKRATVSPVK